MKAGITGGSRPKAKPTSRTLLPILRRDGVSPTYHGGTVYLVRAGHYIVSFEHLVMTQDSRDEPDPKRLPDDVVRVSMATGVTLDFEGRAAEEMRSHLEVVALRSRSAAMRQSMVGEAHDSDDPGDAAGGGRVAGDCL